MFIEYFPEDDRKRSKNLEGVSHDCTLLYLSAVQLLVQIWGRYVMFSILQTLLNTRIWIINVAVFWFKGFLCPFSLLWKSWFERQTLYNLGHLIWDLEPCSRCEKWQQSGEVFAANIQTLILWTSCLSAKDNKKINYRYGLIQGFVSAWRCHFSMQWNTSSTQGLTVGAWK
jgi:hypothetical protein